jgi:hypothetical protein
LAHISTDDIQNIEQIIDCALSSHMKWYDDLLRGLLCRSPLSDAIVAKEAYRYCEFGSWFYGMGKQQVETLPAFVVIGGLHKIMHNSARLLSQQVNAIGYANRADYDYFQHSLKLFRQELKALRHKVALLHQANSAGRNA